MNSVNETIDGMSFSHIHEYWRIRAYYIDIKVPILSYASGSYHPVATKYAKACQTIVMTHSRLAT